VRIKMSDNKRNGKNDMQQMLNNFNQKNVTPTEALIKPINKENNYSNLERGLSDIIKKREKMEDTHTRRTFLVRNELLDRLDKVSKKINNTGFKTEFINFILEKGLNELEEIDKK